MQQNEIVLSCVKLIISGGAAFLAIMLWARTKDGAWMALIAGTILSYAGVVYDILCFYGIIAGNFLAIAGTPFFKLVFAALPGIFYIIAFILMLTKKR